MLTGVRTTECGTLQMATHTVRIVQIHKAPVIDRITTKVRSRKYVRRREKTETTNRGTTNIPVSLMLLFFVLVIIVIFVSSLLHKLASTVGLFSNETCILIT